MLINLYFNLVWQRLYNNGAKKFEVAGVGPIGCCPAYRLKNKTECVSAANDLSAKYNEALQSMLKEWQLEKKDISYSYFDTYAALQDLIHNSTSYGKNILPFVPLHYYWCRYWILGHHHSSGKLFHINPFKMMNKKFIIIVNCVLIFIITLQNM